MTRIIFKCGHVEDNDDGLSAIERDFRNCLECGEIDAQENAFWSDRQ
jgi:hypothetical protein